MAAQFFEIQIKVTEKDTRRDGIIPLLTLLGCHGFIEEEDSILAYLAEEGSGFSSPDGLADHITEVYSLPVRVMRLEDRNWNAEWEQGYAPVLIDDTCLIRAPFHDPVPGVQYDLVIEPRMSFGTAHHETTWLMLKFLLGMDLTGKRVLDMGSGTAVLGILAAMRGASDVWAIDNDIWAYENALDNIRINKVPQVKAMQGDVGLLKGQQFDLILANINRNILLEDIQHYRQALKPDGLLWMSGFYEADLERIKQEAGARHLAYLRYEERNNWVAAGFKAV
ncbi:MAG TPA: 50S ribosomal protein L11 methyltransferase [Bacteroidales bacterium]|nr:50S ribosomal protein L11 methyltransferase [Bacteroidales bacterium]